MADDSFPKLKKALGNIKPDVAKGFRKAVSGAEIPVDELDPSKNLQQYQTQYSPEQEAAYENTRAALTGTSDSMNPLVELERRRLQEQARNQETIKNSSFLNQLGQRDEEQMRKDAMIKELINRFGK